ncbi:MAG: hypothetical protein CEE38_18710 [Planctomycetes bacterium B3_Pla]|nr:MAG: hypothetical protein CEE38_18710 [Planctomycetes bacterium B3_Pla]
MDRHLTEQELIEHKFKLTSDKQAGATAEHLTGCVVCRRRLEQLDEKFASLDLLREDTHASEELISQVVEQARQPVRRRIVVFDKYSWLGAVAAVLVVGFVLMFGNFTEQAPKQQEFAKKSKLPWQEVKEEPDVMIVAKEPVSAPPSADMKDAAESLGRAVSSQPVSQDKPEQPSFDRSRGLEAEKADIATEIKPVQEDVLDKQPRRSDVGLQETRQYGRRFAGPVAGDLADEEISQEPPFAPASAIELVVLPRRDSVQLTIYNSADLTLVRERRNLTLKKGWNWLQLMWANTLIDPTSLSLEPVEQGDKIDIQQLVFPARLRELGRWLIRSEISGQVPFEITYFTSGLSWRAFYMGTLSQDEKSMKMQGYVRIGNNSGEDYENAQTRLIVGKVHLLDQIVELAKRQYPYNRPLSSRGLGGYEGGMLKEQELVVERHFFGINGDSGGMLVDDRLMRKEIVKEGLSEYFLYTIEGTETIPNQWGKRLLSFDVEDIEVESLYKYDEERWGKQAIRFVKFANDEEHNLGDTPIPNGAVKIYGKADTEGHLSYVGGANIKYIPVDEEVELNLGPARLVEVEPKLMEFKTDNYVFDRRGNVSGWDEIRTWKIEITNTRTLPIEIEITRGFGTPYWTLRTEAAHEKHDATHARFTAELEPRSKQTLEYTVTTYHGAREEALTQ